jgi:alkylation response protein AidB-like acyl-CoA dehydrogenase
VRQLIARAHVDDWMQAQMTARVVERMTSGGADPSLASLIKLGLGIVQPKRAGIAMELAGRSGIAWEPDDDAQAGPATAYLNGRIMSIAGGSDQIQRNIISERVLGLPREPSADADKPFREVLRDAKSWGTKAGA